TRSAEIRRHAIALLERIAHGRTYARCLAAVADMIEHLCRTEDQRTRIGDALAGDVRRRAVYGFEDRGLGADVRSRRKAEAADETGAEIRDDVAEEIRRDDHVELLGPHHQ